MTLPSQEVGVSAWIVDLGCGKGGWTHAFLARGYRVVGYDIQRFPEYPGELVLHYSSTRSADRALIPAPLADWIAKVAA